MDSLQSIRSASRSRPFIEQISRGKDDGHATGQIVLGDLDFQELLIEAVNHGQIIQCLHRQSIFAMRWVS